MNVTKGNITTGSPVKRQIDGGTLQVGTVGYFYGEVEPRVLRAPAVIVGWYRDRGGYTVTFNGVNGRTTTSAPAAKFAAYTDQEDALRAFQERKAQYRAATDAKDWDEARRLVHLDA